MTFNSLPFVLFFLTVTSLYFLVPAKWRWLLLVAASCYFYMYWNAWLILVIIFATSIDFFTARLIERESRPAWRKALLIVSLVSNLGILGLFKYYDFLAGSVNAALHGIGLGAAVPLVHLILPIGISFHTFQALSYTIDVYRGVTKTERHYGIYLLYILFYPQLVSGPIERSHHFLPQLHQEHSFDSQRVVRGLRLMLWGLFKKTVIADRLALYVNQVYATPAAYTGAPLLVATVFFAFQIYCDFSGYTDIAIGAARVMGYELMTNFSRPYLARSIPDFWHRWHISLSTWFRDYVYKPMGGNRGSWLRWCWNVMVVFVLSGLWHGANWTYVVWGAIHGVYLIVHRLFQKERRTSDSPLVAGLEIGTTFSLVTLAWIFFRARTLPDAWYVLTHLFAFNGAGMRIDSLEGAPMSLAAGLIFLLMAIQVLQERMPLDTFLEARPLALRWACYMVALLGILFFGVDASIQFIYFQF